MTFLLNGRLQEGLNFIPTLSITHLSTFAHRAGLVSRLDFIPKAHLTLHVICVIHTNLLDVYISVYMYVYVFLPVNLWLNFQAEILK